MATKRFVLYVKHEEECALLYPWMKSQTHVQVVDKLDFVPKWMQAVSLPVLVDKVKLQAVWGPEELECAMQARKPSSKFSGAAPLDDI